MTVRTIRTCRRCRVRNRCHYYIDSKGRTIIECGECGSPWVGRVTKEEKEAQLERQPSSEPDTEGE